MKNKNARVLTKEELTEQIKKSKIEMLITAGAGDIDQLVEPIKNILINHILNLQKNNMI